jgi:glycosyltransferase involved in cell wall biosynthesis
LFVRAKPSAQNHPAAVAEKQREQPKWKRHILLALQTPDASWGWYFPAVRAGKRLLDQERFSAILSSAPPWTAHLVAKALARQSRLPWIADFRDPWVGNRADTPKWRSRLDMRMEAACVRKAARVICNTDLVRDQMRARYASLGSERFVTITNGFDDVIEQPNRSVSEPPFILLHAGELYASRRIDTFSAALRQLIQENKLRADDVKAVFLGHSEPMIRQMASSEAPELVQQGTISFCPPVSYQEARTAIQHATVLLVFLCGQSNTVPQKVYEYLSSGKVIFATAKPGAVTQLIEETGCGIWADCDDIGQIKTKLLRAIELGRTGRPRPVSSFNHFHFRNLTSNLADVIRHVTSQNQG